MIDKIKALEKQISPKFNIVRAILALIAAVGFIGTIITTILVLVFNKSISDIINTAYYDIHDKANVIKQNSLDTYFQNLSPEENEMIDQQINNTIMPDDNDKIFVYGPNLILKYYGITYLTYALLFITMGIVFIFSDIKERKIHNFIKECSKKI